MTGLVQQITRFSRARLTLIVATILLLLYAAAAVALFAFQRSLIFSGDKTDLKPSQVGLPEASVHHLRTQDGAQLVAWSVRGTGKYLAIYFHGNGASLSGRASRISWSNRPRGPSSPRRWCRTARAHRPARPATGHP